HIQLQLGFISLFENDADACDEFAVGPGPTGGPVVSGDTHAGPQELPPESSLELFRFWIHGVGRRMDGADAGFTKSQRVSRLNRSVSTILQPCHPAILQF